MGFITYLSHNFGDLIGSMIENIRPIMIFVYDFPMQNLIAIMTDNVANMFIYITSQLIIIFTFQPFRSNGRMKPKEWTAFYSNIFLG